MKAFLRSQRADLVCLQETKKQAHVGFGSEKSGIRKIYEMGKCVLQRAGSVYFSLLG